VRYNFADIGDYKIFTNNPLQHASTASKFARSTRAFKTEKTDFEHFLSDNETVAFLVIKNDTILYEKYFNEYDTTSIVPSFSMAKSVTSALIGCAIDDKLIQSVDEPVTNYIPEMAKNGFDKVTLRHLLNMNTGLAFNESYVNPTGEAAKFYYGDQLENYILNLKLATAPGSGFDYISGNTQILGYVLHRVLQKTPHKTVTNYLQTKLWTPLGCEFDASWSTDHAGGIEKTFCCLNARARDFAKFGELYLHKGNWHGKQLISEKWVTETITPNTDEKNSLEYHYQFWFPSQNGDYTARGILGQFIYVNPKNNVVIVRLGADKGKVDWYHWLSEWGSSL
jgi:CubicO group peptidase (beta-lactamase class C family)